MTRTGNGAPTAAISAAGVQRLHETMAGYVESGHLPGLVTLVASGDEVHVDTVGTPTFTDERPLAHDAIFRIASLTKPMTAVAATDVRRRRDVAARRADRRSPPRARQTAGAPRRRRRARRHGARPPADHTARLADLPARLRISDGAGRYVPDPARGSGVQAAEHRRSALAADHARCRQLDPRARIVAAHVPTGRAVELRDFRPGARCPPRVRPGNHSKQCCARASSSRWVCRTPASRCRAQLHRFATAYRENPETGALSVLDDPAHSWWSTPPTFPDAAGGLVSTIDDLWAFVSMLLRGGTAAAGASSLRKPCRR